MKELISNLSGRKIILLLAEVSEKNVVSYFYLHPSLKAQVIASALGGQMLNGYMGTFKSTGAELLEVEKQVLEYADLLLLCEHACSPFGFLFFQERFCRSSELVHFPVDSDYGYNQEQRRK